MKSEEALALGALPAPLRDPVGVVRRRGWWMLAVMGLGLVATLVGVRLWVTPVFAAHASVLVSNPRLDEDFVRRTVGDEGTARLNAMVAEALSRDRLLVWIQDYDLYPELRREAPISLVVEAMRNDLQITPESGIAPRGYFATPELFRVSFRSRERELAATIANELTDAFVEAGTRMRSSQVETTTALLEQDLERAERALEAHRVELEALRKRSYERRHVRELQRELDQLRESLADEKTRYTGEHPTVVSLEGRIERLVAEIREVSRRSGARAAQRELDAARKTEEALAERYVDALGRLQEARLAAQVEAQERSERVVVLERAEPPTVPERSRRNYYAAGALLSASLAAVLGLLLELRDPVMVSADELEEDFEVPVLGTIPRIR